MYLFLFAVLYIIFQYANSKKTFEMQEAKIGSLREKVEALEQTKDSLQNTSVTASSQDGYSLESDDKVKMYIEELGYNIDDFKKECLIEGYDDIALSLNHKSKIESFENKIKSERPWIFND